MHFRLIGAIHDVEVIAKGTAIRELKRLRRAYGRANWRKMKGFARIRMSDGTICTAELHWYEAHGVGKFEYKIKRIVEQP